MPSLQARIFAPIVRLIVKRENWGPDEYAVARRARNVFGAPKLRRWQAARSVRLTKIADGDVRGEWLEPKNGTTGDAVLLYIHGGGFVACWAASHRPVTAALANLTGLPVFGVDYRRAPEHRFPVPLDDVVTAYRWLRKRYPACKIAVAGDSAGGGLVLSLCLRLREAGEEMPGCLVCFSPWTDLTASGESVKRNAARDAMFYPSTCPAFARAYVSNDAELTDPLASPAFAAYNDFPPALFHVGSPELLVDDSVRVHEKILAAGGDSRLEIYDGVFHAWQMGVGLVPEADASLNDAAEFIKQRTADC